MSIMFEPRAMVKVGTFYVRRTAAVREAAQAG
jgi:hypothetical protein